MSKGTDTCAELCANVDNVGKIYKRDKTCYKVDTFNFQENWNVHRTSLTAHDACGEQTPFYDYWGTYMQARPLNTCDCCENSKFCGDHGISYSDDSNISGYKTCKCSCSDGYTGDKCDIPPYLTGSCASNDKCASGSCQGGNCCADAGSAGNGLSAGCTSCHQDGSCTICAAGYYRDNWTCQKCPVNKTSPAGSVSPIACTIPNACTSDGQCPFGLCKGGFCCADAGNLGNGLSAGCTSCHQDGSCTICAAGYYRDNWTCQKCPVNKTSSAGSTDSSECAWKKSGGPIIVTTTFVGPDPYWGQWVYENKVDRDSNLNYSTFLNGPWRDVTKLPLWWRCRPRDVCTVEYRTDPPGVRAKITPYCETDLTKDTYSSYDRVFAKAPDLGTKFRCEGRIEFLG